MADTPPLALVPPPAPRTRSRGPIAGPSMRIPRAEEGPKGTPRPSAEVLAELRAFRPRVLDIVRGHGDGVTFGEIAKQLPGLSTSRLVSLMSAMVMDRSLIRLIRLHQTAYRLPVEGDDFGAPVRDIPVPPFDPVQLREAVAAILAARRGCVVDELVSKARETTVYASRETVERALEQLIAAGRARMVQFGAFVRYQAAVPA